EAAGLRRVATYIQSGNVVFESAKPPKAVKALVEGVLRDRFGLANVCVLRPAARLAAAVDANPFGDAAAERPSLLILRFLGGKPAAGARAALERYEGPERLHLAG